MKWTRWVRLEMMWVKMGGGCGRSAELVGRRNNCAALFWIICASVSLCCLKVIRSSFHRQRSFLCMVKVHFSWNILYVISFSVPFFCQPFVCWSSSPPQSISLSHSSCLSDNIAVLFIRLSSSVLWHPMWEVYLWYRTIWRCCLRTKQSHMALVCILRYF